VKPDAIDKLALWLIREMSFEYDPAVDQFFHESSGLLVPGSELKRYAGNLKGFREMVFMEVWLSRFRPIYADDTLLVPHRPRRAS
jgi:hypothetical protein